MLSLKHVLYPVDFSPPSRAVAPFVKAMAGRFGSKVTVLNVSDSRAEAAASDSIPDDEPSGTAPPSRLEAALANELSNLAVTYRVESGEAADVISRFANTEGVDLIMISTRGEGPFRSARLGSVANRILDDALCPVWTAAHSKDLDTSQHAGCRSVLCAVDGTPKSTPLMQWAGSFASATGASVRLVHAISKPGSPEQTEHNRRGARAAIGALQRSAGLEKAPLTIVTAEVPSAIRAEAEREPTDLIIVGRGLLRETLSHVYQVILHSSCPVLSV